MELIACDIKQAYEMKCKRTYTKWLDILMDFKNSSDKCVQVLDYGHAAVNNCVWAINTSIRIHHLYELTAFQRGGAAFIAKKDYL